MMVVMAPGIIAKQYQVNGVVQGVGFRPFVFQLAEQHQLTGHVANTAGGVSILVEGSQASLSAFARDLARRHPPLAFITAIESTTETVAGHRHFSIIKSEAGDARDTLISPDVCVCADCLQEMFDPRDRRYRYPFINCTNCGPRYTIIKDIPYDRPQTSMGVFTMCPQCQAEYDDPRDRRFHAQPNACPVCGPRVQLLNVRGEPVAAEDPIAHSAGLLKAGHILAIKGLGGFHLAVDAENDTAVGLLRTRKVREEKPLALMSPDMATIASYAHIPQAAAELLTSIQRPIVLLEKRKAVTIAPQVAPGNSYFGVMLPYTPLHYLLMEHGFTALVMTSANLSEEPIAIDNDEALGRLGKIADYFLVHNRGIYLRSDDTVLRRSAGATRMIRRSRGYVPLPVLLAKPVPPILAVGAELKNTICLAKARNAFVSQHIGDLENPATYDFFQMTIDHLGRILGIEPDILAHDLHPDYLSTRFAREQTRWPTLGVQHHHAHIASCLAENRVAGPVIGLALDGTGYGRDGHIWGGEVLLADAREFTRRAHFAYVPMPGGAMAIKAPWRMALSYLEYAYGEAFLELDLRMVRNLDPLAVTTMRQMIQKKLNSPLTSSAGRLFDGVAALAGLKNEVAFEGQAAMLLEMAAGDEAGEPYRYAWRERDGCYQIDPAPIIRGVVADLLDGAAPALISRRFHATLIRLFTELCQQLRRETHLTEVALSGGVFQNDRLLSGLLESLQQEGFTVYTHKLVPANDGGISLGQAVVAASLR